MDQDSNDPLGEGDPMGSNPDKSRQKERHLRQGARFEERKQNLIQRKQRGHGPPSRMGSLDDEDDDEDYGTHGRSRSRHAGRSTAVAQPNARVSGVARTEVTVLMANGEERVVRVLPRVHAAGGIVVGDDVEIDAQDRLVARAERRTVLERRAPGDARRTRVLAANVDVGAVVMVPRSDGLSLGFLDRAILALENGGIEPCIVITKIDLEREESREALRLTLAPWIDASIDVHFVSSPTGEGIAPLADALRGRVAVVLGHSGVGKSTLINALDPEAGQLTGATRSSDGRGRHTTTSSTLLPFLDGGALVDTPGVRQLAPDVSDVDAMARSIPELVPYLDQCRFHDCAHVGEPGCAIEAAAETDPGVVAGLRRLRRLMDE